MYPTVLLRSFPTCREAVDRLAQVRTAAQLALVNVDGVSRMNYDIGWRTSDQVIQAVGAALQRRAAQQAASVFRTHGSEFLVIAENRSSSEWLRGLQLTLADTSVCSVDQPGLQVPLLVGIFTASVAVYTSPWPKAILADFLARAEAALHPRQTDFFLHTNDA